MENIGDGDDRIPACFFSDDTPRLSPEVVEILNRLKEEMATGPKSLPQWSGDHGASPNEIVRSALFTARNRNQQRAYFKEEEIVVMGGGSIVYLGEELRQDDELVWMRLLQLAKGRPLGEATCFTPYSFLKSIGWRTNNWGYTHLRTCLLRMKATAIQITTRRLGRTVVTSLIDYIEMSTPEKQAPLSHWEVRISKVMSLLFSDEAFTLIDLQQRKKLPEGIATKLHSYWSSHREPYPVKVETLQKLCGSENDLRQFKRHLKRALDALTRVGFLEGWTVDGVLVTVVRKRC